MIARSNVLGQAKRLPTFWQIGLALFALAGLVAMPLLLYGPPMVVDAPLHYYRLVELNIHVGQGDLYPRWFSHINHGYGGPLINFYPSLSIYTALLLHLIGLSLPAAFVGSFVLATAVAVVGMYAWVNEHFESPIAGLGAAAIYTLSPYFYYNVLVRGALPEAWGLAFAPWVLWGLLRLLRTPNKSTYIAFVLFGAALVLSHALVTLLVAPICLIYALILLRQSEQPIQRLKWLSVALLHLAALTAFFVLPFFLESDWIGLRRAQLHYEDFFIPLSDLFSLPIPFDPNLARNPFPLAIPLVPLLGGVAAVVLFIRTRKDWQTPAVFGLLLMYGLMTVSASLPVWQALPIGSLIQFPWRFLGPIMLMLAWLCGAGIAFVNNRVAVFIFITASLLFGLTWSYRYPTEESYPASGQPVDVIRYELESPVSIGLTFQQEFLPKWVIAPEPTGSLLDQFTANPNPSRLQPLPDDVTILRDEPHLTSATVEYDSPREVEATFNLLYFPGWVGEVDGQAVTVEPTDDGRGLLHLTLPAGHHTLQLSLRPTTTQFVSTLISLVAFISLISLISLAFFVRSSVTATTQNPTPAMPGTLWPYIALFGLLAVARGTGLEWWETPFKYARITHIPAPVTVPVAFGNQMALLGTKTNSLPDQPADQPIPVTLYWQALADLTDDYHISIQLVDAEGNRFGLSDQYPGLIPTSGWKQGQYLPDPHTLEASPGTPPGSYKLMVSVYRLLDGGDDRLSWSAEDGTSGSEYEAAHVTLLPGWHQQSEQLQVIQSSVNGNTFGVGEPVSFTIGWLTGPTPPPGLLMRFTVADLNGNDLFYTDLPPAGAGYPSDQWLPNQMILFPHTVILPPDLPAGSVLFFIQFVDEDGQPASRAFGTSTMTITVPERTFEVPRISHPVDYVFADSIRLLGYDVSGDALTLYWQAVEPVSMPLTVYVHDFNAAGEFIGGHDSPPARSVTSWLPGEVITDVRPLPAGDIFEIGLYNSRSGELFGNPYLIHP